jgi:hypothetical protein
MNKIITEIKTDQRIREISRQARKEIIEGKNEKITKKERLEINNKRRMIETRQGTNKKK